MKKKINIGGGVSLAAVAFVAACGSSDAPLTNDDSTNDNNSDQNDQSSVVRGDEPNVIIFFVDDIGFECFPQYGGESYSTPCLNELSARGMVFNYGFASPISTASRVKLLTGMYNSDNYTQWGTLPLSERTFANALQEQGYATAAAGKWQLSYYNTDPISDPYTFGFDEYMLYSLCLQADKGDPRYKSAVLNRNGDEVSLNDLYGPDVVNSFVLDFIERKKDQPFLIYYPMILTHDPFQHTPDSDGYDDLLDLTTDDPSHFSDMVTYMDKLVGRTVDKLDELGLSDNTLILFTGDNGTKSTVTSIFNGASYTGGKTYTKKAGMHVPLFAIWPKVIQSGSVNDNLVDLTDFYTTILEATDTPTTNEREDLRGVSFYDQLRGESTAKVRDFIFTSYFGKQDTPQKQYAFNKEYKVYATGEFYDMQNDWSEKTNITDRTPEQQEIYDELMTIVDQYKRE